ncbi:MAG: ABC transporter substrate-binding protein [Bacteroidales bacterium]|nr:ABC transporter substrate-binding protein [Bacteroidales bacterium]
MKKVFVVCFLALFVLCGCGRRAAEVPSVYWSGKDSYGREVTLSKEPQRIISLSPCITEIIFMLESENRLVGISDFCTYPEGTDTIPHLGGLLDINVEALCARRPDIVLVGSIVSPEVIEQFERVNVPVFIVKAESAIEDIYEAVSVIGEIVGKQELAEQHNAELKKEIDAVKATQPSMGKHPLVYYVVGFGEAGDYTAPANSHINEIITIAGGENVGKSLKSWSISREFLFEHNPDIIFVRKEDAELFAKSKPYSSLKAVKSGHLYPIESGWIDIVSPRNLNAIKLIAEKCAEFEHE